MPDADIHMLYDGHAYRLADAALVVCWALRHPSPPNDAPPWKRLRDLIALVTRREISWGPPHFTHVARQVPHSIFTDRKASVRSVK
jgi:hypothetical protein